MKKTNTCPTCGAKVKVVGKTTMHYESVVPSLEKIEEIIANSDMYSHLCIAYGDSEGICNPTDDIINLVQLIHDRLEGEE